MPNPDSEQSDCPVKTGFFYLFFGLIAVSNRKYGYFVQISSN